MLLHEASESAVEQTRQRIGQVAAEEGQSIGRLMEDLIAQRIRSIDPILTSAAENVMRRFSGEIEQKIGSKVEEARRTVSEITDASGRANELQGLLQQQLSDATAQSANIQDSIQSRVHQVTDAAVQKAVSDLIGTQQEFDRLRTELHQHAQQVSNELLQRKSGALEYIQQASTEAVQSALSRLAGASHEADRLQEAIRSQVEQASGQVTLIEHAAREKVQRESDAAVQKAVWSWPSLARK